MIFWNLVIAAASFILQLVLAPKPQNAKPGSLDDVDAPVAEEGWEIPVVFGTPVMKGPNCVWYGDFDADAIKGPRRYGFFGPRQTVGHQYQVGMHLVLCHGVADQIRYIMVGDKELWKPPTGQTYTALPVYLDVNKPNLFGGKDREGGIWGSVQIENGAPWQGQNAYLVHVLGVGAATPAFRGVVSVILKNRGNDMSGMHIGTTTYLKPWEFTIMRIHQTSQGTTQWYDEKAAVPESLLTGSSYGPGSRRLFWGETANGNEGDTYGEYTAYYCEGPRNGLNSTAQKGINVWHHPDYTHQLLYTADNAGHYGQGNFVYITKFGELMTRELGDIWASSHTHLRFRRISNIDDILQDIDVGAIIRSMGELDINFSQTASDWSDWMIIKFGPHIYSSTPWALLHRSGGNWDIVFTHLGMDLPGYANYSVGGLSMGPKYVYGGVSNGPGHSLLRLRWDPDHWSEEVIDLNAFPIDFGINAEIHVKYWEPTDEVILTIYNQGGGHIYVMDSEITMVKRGRGIITPGYSLGRFTHTRNQYDATSIIVSGTRVDAFGGSYLEHIYIIKVADLSVVRDIIVDQTTYADKDGVLIYMMYNQQAKGLTAIGHMIGPAVWWPIPSVEGIDMNPSHIIRECLTDPLWGMGYTDADIDDASFIYAADYLYNECFGLTLVWAREEKIEEFVSIVLSHIDAYLYLKRSTGKFVLKLIRSDYDINSLPIIDEDDIINWEEIEHRQPAESVNSVTVIYTNRANRGKEASHQVDNIAQIAQLGDRISATRNYPGIQRGSLAVQVAARDQKSLGIGLITGKITSKRTTLEELYPGDPFRLVSSRHDLDGEVFRVVDMRLGDGRDNKLEVNIAQDVFNLNPSELVDTSTSDWENPFNPPQVIEPRFLWEMPYREMVQSMGPADTDTILNARPTAGLLQTTGKKPAAGSLDAELYVNGISIDTVDFAPFGYLSDNITTFQTSFNLTLASDLTKIEAGDLGAIIGVDNEHTEIIQVSAVAGNNITVSRGLLDTIPQNHTMNQQVFIFDRFSGTDFTNRFDGDTATVRLLTRTMLGNLEYDLAPEDTITYTARAIRPLRPANVKVEGFAEGPVDGTGLSGFDTTWSNRNRLEEINIIQPWTAASVTLESGQTTIIEVLNPEADTVITTHSGLIGTSFFVPNSSFDGNPSGWIRVGAERDGYREWQAYTIECYVEGTDLLFLDDDALTLDGETLFVGEEA